MKAKEKNSKEKNSKKLPKLPDITDSQQGNSAVDQAFQTEAKKLCLPSIDIDEDDEEDMTPLKNYSGSLNATSIQLIELSPQEFISTPEAVNLVDSYQKIFSSYGQLPSLEIPQKKSYVDRSIGDPLLSLNIRSKYANKYLSAFSDPLSLQRTNGRLKSVIIQSQPNNALPFTYADEKPSIDDLIPVNPIQIPDILPPTFEVPPTFLVPRLPHDSRTLHFRIIQLMKTLGYPAEDIEDGVCFGIAAMASQAALLGEKGINKFNARIITFEKEYDELLKIVNNSRYDNASIKKYSDLRAFFDGVYLYQLVKDIHGINEKQFTQTTQIPKKFEILKPKAIKGSKLDISKSSFLACFTQEELQYFLIDLNIHLEELCKNLPKEDPPKNETIIFFIGSQEHQVAIIYNQEMNQYFFVDANVANPNMLIKYDLYQLPELADRLFKSFLNLNPFKSDEQAHSIAIGIKVYLSSDSKLPIEEIITLNTTAFNKPKPKWVAALTRNDSTANDSTLLQLANLYYQDRSVVAPLLDSFEQEKKNTLLIEAIYKGDVKLIKMLLGRNGADINSLINNDTILTHAIYLGNINVINCLLTEQLVITDKILNYLVRPENIMILELLLKNERLTQEQKNKALAYIIYSTETKTKINKEVFDLLLRYGADLNAIINNDTILTHAIYLEVDISDIIVSLKTQIVVNERMLSYAIEKNNLDLLKQLLNINSDIDQNMLNISLVRSIYKKNIDMIKELLLKGADINALINNNTILTHAIYLNDLQIILFLLEKSECHISVKILQYAIEKDKSLFILLLEKSKLDNQLLNLAMNGAIMSNNVEAIKLIATKMVDGEPIKISEQTFNLAITHANPQTMLTLIGSLQLDDKMKKFSLLKYMQTSHNINNDVVKALLKAGADVNCPGLLIYVLTKHKDLIGFILNAENLSINDSLLKEVIELENMVDFNIILQLVKKRTSSNEKELYDAIVYEMLYSKRQPVIVSLLHLIFPLQSNTIITEDLLINLLRFALHSYCGAENALEKETMIEIIPIILQQFSSILYEKALFVILEKIKVTELQPIESITLLESLFKRIIEADEEANKAKKAKKAKKANIANISRIINMALVYLADTQQYSLVEKLLRTQVVEKNFQPDIVIAVYISKKFPQNKFITSSISVMLAKHRIKPTTLSRIERKTIR